VTPWDSCISAFILGSRHFRTSELNIDADLDASDFPKRKSLGSTGLSLVGIDLVTGLHYGAGSV
jgi:hypothetical protein